MTNGQVTAYAIKHALFLLNDAYSIYNTPEHIADGIDPTEQAKFETDDQGTDLVVEAMIEEELCDHDMWECEETLEIIEAGVQAAIKYWTPEAV